MAYMSLAETLGDEQLDVAADELGARVAEQRLRASVDELDNPASVDNDDRVGRALEQTAELLLQRVEPAHDDVLWSPRMSPGLLLPNISSVAASFGKRANGGKQANLSHADRLRTSVRPGSRGARRRSGRDLNRRQRSRRQAMSQFPSI